MDDRPTTMLTPVGEVLTPAGLTALGHAVAFDMAWREAEAVLSDGWTLHLSSRATQGYRAEARNQADKLMAHTVASTPDGALRELSDVITESHVND